MEKKLPPRPCESRTTTVVSIVAIALFLILFLAFQDGAEWLVSSDAFYGASFATTVARCIALVVVVLAIHAGVIAGIVILIFAMFYVRDVGTRARYYWRVQRKHTKGPTP